MEVDDSAQNRLEKIVRIIERCPFGIHDISRTGLYGKDRLPRFNMPFELGIDFGCRRFGNRAQRCKRLLVLDKERYRFQKYLSDVSGSDIKAHSNTEQGVIRSVCEWLRSHSSDRASIPGPAAMCRRYCRFKHELPQIARELRLRVAEIQYADLMTIMEDWLIMDRC